ncbi:complex I NDUFA9 subunit family protein [Neorickettsia sp. 179522]|uniref:complex I NDUFA9 subunit family protein n=1 Tax=Neorickettsia sp. 179522 TaxID=1714371 RepID=UPI000798FF6C|nr:complex I NDUFA9 subunit family protein [Neorickettsia sp. 179522]KYH12897.1 NADH-ubiquinone oxidoreductase [Neorickettsia sp. 179522]
MKKITVFGGSGFIGSYVVRELVKSGYQVTVVSGSFSCEKKLKLSGNLGQISVVYGDIRCTADIIRGIGNSEIVINMVGILRETPSASFDTINHVACARVAQIAAERGVRRFIHFSALLGCKGATKYGRSKINGEEAVRSAFPESIIIRPGVVFGEEDNFINLFVKLSKKLRILFLPACKTASIQPVYVGDLALLVTKILQDETLEGATYRVVGAKRYTLNEICSLVSRLLGITVICVPIPYWMALCEAAVLECFLLKPINKFISGRTAPIITREQVKMLKYGSVSDENALQEFDVPVTSLEEKLCSYIKTI